MTEAKTKRTKTTEAAKPAGTGKSLGEQIAELDRQVEWFYSDDFKLEEAVDKYQTAAKLAKKIESDLENLRNEIEVLTEDFTTKN